MNNEDVVYWPDGTWCFGSELEEFFSTQSDDYEVFKIGSPKWQNLMDQEEIGRPDPVAEFAAGAGSLSAEGALYDHLEAQAPEVFSNGDGTGQVDLRLLPPGW